MADILCPNCGMPNSDEQAACSFCKQPLPPVQKSESIRPGETPTKKITAELEPILPKWLRDVRETARRTDEESAGEETQAAAEAAASKDDSSDWLAGLESASREEQDEEIPEWMRGAPPVSAPAVSESEQPFPRRREIRWEEEEPAETAAVSAPESGEALPSWISGAAEEPDREKDEVSDWLASRAGEPQKPVSPFPTGALEPPSTGELTDWLDKATVESVTPGTQAGAEPEPLGDWLSNLPRGETLSASAETEESFGEDIDLPAWMRSTGEPPSAPKEETPGDSLPDWMSVFREPEASAEPPVEAAEPAPTVPPAAPFISHEEPAQSSQADELFSIEMPDWLSNIAPVEQKPESQEGLPPEAIAPADLPSWVQAMRPVETVLPGAESAPPPVEGPQEERGPLAGLRGVLPLAEMIQPGKPRAQSILLQPSESQQADASLLEQMLAAETQAEPIRGRGTLTSQRVLRWALSAALILLAALSLLGGSQSVPLPSALPAEAALALPVLDSLPEGAPILMIFDYEPALAGELEAAAAPFVDRLLALASPRVTVLSTSPTGAALAERFLAKARYHLMPGQEYINLGYLPGGETGILSFAENPRAAAPSSLWDSPAALGVHRFADYAAVILLTDQAAAARSWVEQTGAQREGHPLVVICSAQAAPMIQPYLLSGQVNGLVSGLHGGAAFENFGGLGSIVRRYWDAYNFGLLAAALAIVVGGLWNFIARLRVRRQGLDEV